jgi:GDP/UDP-N,N'-diacetylbacillosamine 2-epimerase (hydrolysing)
MTKICIVTATRAEYGLLRPLMLAFADYEGVDLRIVVTGAHLCREFGYTYQEIEDDGFVIDEKIDMLLSADSPSGISKSMGLALMGFSDYFKRVQPELLIILGDRYESLSVAIAAMNEHIPIAHLYGGETTEGAIDEGIRHAITKLSLLHFTSAEVYRKRVIQMGESPDRVFNVGALGIENILKEPLYTRDQLSHNLNFDLSKPFALVTFHPVTLELNTSEEQVTELLRAIDEISDMNFIFTKANADANGQVINEMIEAFCLVREHAVVYSSLGLKRYLSALKYCEVVVGNSSSGLIEAPSFKVPTVNIGDRQKGRLQSESVLNCLPKSSDIIKCINAARQDSFKRRIATCQNPYGDGHSSAKIVEVIMNEHNRLKTLKKKFYDIPFGK